MNSYLLSVLIKDLKRLSFRHLPKPLNRIKKKRLSKFGSSDDICSICFETNCFEPNCENISIITDCGHHFHINCICKWLMLINNNTCPNCRSEISENFINQWCLNYQQGRSRNRSPNPENRGRSRNRSPNPENRSPNHRLTLRELQRLSFSGELTPSIRNEYGIPPPVRLEWPSSDSED
jgi:hypothetical protein